MSVYTRGGKIYHVGDVGTRESPLPIVTKSPGPIRTWAGSQGSRASTFAIASGASAPGHGATFATSVERPIMKPEVFGPCLWGTIHLLAASYDKTQEGARSFMSFIHSLEYQLPCSTCRASFSRHLHEIPVDPYLENRTKLLFWTYILHDKVNKELGKASPPWEKVSQYYLGKTNCSSCEV